MSDPMADNRGILGRSGEADRRCFGCGTENPIGLHLHFERIGDAAEANFSPIPEHQGWDGIVHGGILLTVRDETLAYAALFTAGIAVTAELKARLRRPAPLNETYRLRGEVTRQRLPLIEARATITDARGQLIAEASGKFMLTRATGPAR